MKSKLKKYKFVDSEIYDSETFIGDPQNLKDVLKFLENKFIRSFNENAHRNQSKLSFVNFNFIGK